MLRSRNVRFSTYPTHCWYTKVVNIIKSIIDFIIISDKNGRCKLLGMKKINWVEVDLASNKNKTKNKQKPNRLQSENSTENRINIAGICVHRCTSTIIRKKKQYQVYNFKFHLAYVLAISVYMRLLDYYFAFIIHAATLTRWIKTIQLYQNQLVTSCHLHLKYVYVCVSCITKCIMLTISKKNPQQEQEYVCKFANSLEQITEAHTRTHNTVPHWDQHQFIIHRVNLPSLHFVIYVWITN